jgi:hypothetical protein
VESITDLSSNPRVWFYWEEQSEYHTWCYCNLDCITTVEEIITEKDYLAEKEKFFQSLVS